MCIKVQVGLPHIFTSEDFEAIQRILYISPIEHSPTLHEAKYTRICINIYL